MTADRIATEMTSSGVPDKNKRRSVMKGSKFMQAYKKRFGDKNTQAALANAPKKPTK